MPRFLMPHLAMPRLAALLICLLPSPALAAQGFAFANIDGGTHELADWSGQPVLIVNTASRCGFTSQYAALQTLYDRYKADGLVVLAVPSDDFRQELSSAEAVKAFCEANFGLTLPMTDITSVRGAEAHPFYRWLADAHGMAPAWNFNKVLLDPKGAPVAIFGAATRPLSAPITGAIERLLD